MICLANAATRMSAPLQDDKGLQPLSRPLRHNVRANRRPTTAKAAVGRPVQRAEVTHLIAAAKLRRQTLAEAELR